VDLESRGGIGGGGSGGEGVDYAFLDGSKKRRVGVGSHFDDERSMRVCGMRGIPEGVLFVFRGMGGILDW